MHQRRRCGQRLPILVLADKPLIMSPFPVVRVSDSAQSVQRVLMILK